MVAVHPRDSRKEELVELCEKLVQDRRLIIVSDLLQNVATYSHYTTAPDYEQFRHSPYAKFVSTSFAGIEVEIVYLNNQTAREAGQPHETPLPRAQNRQPPPPKLPELRGVGFDGTGPPRALWSVVC